MGWGGDVNVRLEVEHATACYAEHGVGWGCERSFEVEHATAATLIMGWGWGGVGWGCSRSLAFEHATHATLSMGWGGDVNVRLKLNTPLMRR